jgi:hypothetical protein
MTLVRGIRAGGALALLLLVPQLAPAAWDNVFQVTCFGCRRNQTSSSYFIAAPAPSCSSCQSSSSFFIAAPSPCTSCAPPCPAPCPTTTAYVQRTYFQPVTTLQAETHFEPVTSVRTSFFWEPVTSVTVSSFFDPCTGCHQVATPVTSFRLRQQCNSVVNYVARVSYRPVTTMRQSSYMEAVQVPACPAPCPTCPSVAAAPACPSCAAGAVAPAAPPATVAPPLNLPAEPPPAALNEQRSLPPAGVSEQREQYYMPPATPSGRPAPKPATYKPERVASYSGSTVTGQVVRSDYAPRAGAKVTFVNAQRQDDRQATLADGSGRFQVSLASGHWYVYVDGAYHNQMDVNGPATSPVTVVSR